MNVDLAITGGRILDGTGSPEYWGDLGIQDDRISLVGPQGSLLGKARRTIDAAGMVVSPGFIDMHTHSDLMPLVDPRCSAKIMQGVTTEVIGQDGLSYAPLTDETLPYFRTAFKGLNGDPEGLFWDWRSVAEYLQRFDRRVAVNVAFLAPHGNLRAAVLGLADRRPTESELDEMKGLLSQAMREGAFGLSTGLTYAPCSFGDSRELAGLCEVVARHGGYFAPHMRNYGSEMEAALEEVIEIAGGAGLPLHLTHFQASFSTGKGKADHYLRRIDRARREGLEVSLDAYPYLAASTFMAGLLPGWSHEGGPDRLIRRLSDAATREKIRHEMEAGASDGLQKLPAQWETIVVTDVGGEKNADLVGWNVAEISRRLGKTPFDCFADLLVEERLAVSCLLFIGHEENLQKFMCDPAFMAGSDGLLIGRRPHPRAWGTFARYLARYVRELGVLSLPECIRKMTSLPARRLGLRDRGLLKPGRVADLVVFDPDRVQDTATYEQPKRHPEGIPYVIVNGQVVKDAGRQTDVLPGRALRNPRH
ncbi:MAG: N-acyl-D-amino-acid deacylase [Planctomycetes bacterium RBG_16_64_12]|nr:MAG: N-acyl-D-amino-acid deacylase [Planctomycetes bacterium RBG_16_64_12]